MLDSRCWRIACGALLGAWLELGALNQATAQGADQPDGSQIKAGSWVVQPIPIAAAPRRIRTTGGSSRFDQVTIETVDGTGYFLAECGEGLCAEPIVNPKPDDPLPEGALPGSQVAVGQHTIAHAWLADPTQRLLGSTLAGPVAGALVIEDITARTFRIDLPTSQAFEDRRPRIVDLGPDHPDTILLVRSDETTGAALVAMGLTGEGLVQTIAETEPLGTPRAWLNPVGAADFTGTGSVDIALVSAPDSGGTLQILTLDGHTFRQRVAVHNVSNHVPGTDIIDMAVVADFDGDGVSDIAVPDGERQRIRILSFANGQVAQPAEIALPAAVVTEIASISPGAGKRPYLLMGLTDGQLVLLH